MISIIRKPPVLRRFKVWDLEWVPGTYRLRVCGVFDPKAGYTNYASIDDFIKYELVPSNRGIWFYAHFGGMADLQFLVARIADLPEYSFRGSTSGASVIIAHIKRNDCSWHFVDSFWLLRAPLRKIGQWIGKHKTGPTEEMDDAQRREWYATIDDKTLRDYNRNDCEVLWYAIAYAQNAIIELGGQLQMTLASTAMNLFRRRYLKTDVQTSRMLNILAGESYIASRVESFQLSVPYPGNYFDINSSFPYAMTKALPGPLRGNFRSIPNEAWESYPFLADCEIEVPDHFLPPLPARIRGRVFFPVGRWRSWFTGVDLKLLVRSGGVIRRVHGCKVFEPFFDLAAYANDLYSKRLAASNLFEKEFYKLALNSLYGKFAEQPDKLSILINPPPRTLTTLNRSSDMMMPGVFFRWSEVPIPHAHVPISSYITALGRETIFDFMSEASEVHYCDTDGFSTPDEFTTGEGLGKLKLEKTFDSARFPAPKLYQWQPSNFPDRPGKMLPETKAKGFSLHRDGKVKAAEKFSLLISGGEIHTNRMVRIRENIRNHNLQPKDKTVIKRLRQLGFLRGDYEEDSMPKRFAYPDGRTRPWSVSEIVAHTKRKPKVIK